MTMEFLVATGIGWVVAVAIYLMLRGRSFTVVLGLSLLGYAVNVLIFSMGRLWAGSPPILGTGAAAVADPLPQALVLTAIVIGFATTGFVIELALRGRHEIGTDQVDGQAPPDERAAGGTPAAVEPPAAAPASGSSGPAGQRPQEQR